VEISIEYIKGQLQRRAGERQLAAVARVSGVNLRTLHRLAKGQAGTVTTAEKVQQFLKDTEKKRKIEEQA
jgi:predicted transcriptional regulator